VRHSCAVAASLHPRCCAAVTPRCAMPCPRCDAVPCPRCDAVPCPRCDAVPCPCCCCLSQCLHPTCCALPALRHCSWVDRVFVPAATAAGASGWDVVAVASSIRDAARASGSQVRPNVPLSVSPHCMLQQQQQQLQQSLLHWACQPATGLTHPLTHSVTISVPRLYPSM
jgi:hypothetical protein